MPIHPRTCSQRTAKPASHQCRSRAGTFLVGTILISLVALAGCGKSEEGDLAGQSSKQQAPATDVGYVELQLRAINQFNPLPGRVVAYQVAEIRPQISGIILSRLFEAGDFVKEGQSLYQIDPARYQAELNIAQAALENAEAGLQNAQALANRYETLVASSAVAEQEYDNAVAALRKAKAAISIAEAEIQAAQINLDYTEVRSPISGQISPSAVTKGALVTNGQPNSLAIVRQLDPVYVDLSQSATAARALHARLTLARLERGADAKFPVKLYMTETDVPYAHLGTLDTTESAVDPQTGTIRLRSIFPNPDEILLPGMFVRAAVADEGRAKAIIVPQKSVKIQPDGKKHVWVIDSEDKAEKRMIQTGAAYGNRWVVLEGLKAGERLIVEGSMTLSEGAKVQPEKITPQD
jgi:membrane fusion protein (multidrug efflux system)